MLTIGSLFSGIGGLELGLEWAGLGPVLWQVEKDEFCRRVLAKHWPDVPRWNDVETVRGVQLPVVDLICGGFPCQDVSSAGYGGGLRGPRSGLWYEFWRLVKESGPRFVVVENVSSGKARWLRSVRHHLHMLGYRTRALGVAAADVRAPHRRARVFVVADTAGERRGPRLDERAAARPGGQHQARSREDGEAGPWGEREPAVVRVVHGLPPGLDGARRRGLGNAVVPQCAQVVGEVIRQMLGGVPTGDLNGTETVRT